MMGNAEPLVSVVMPVYNAVAHIDDAVESVLHQTYRTLELVIWDDGSDADAAAKLERVERLDTRVRVLRGEHRGLAPALNAGCRAADGKYIARLDADDAALPDRIAQQVQALEERPALGLVGGGAIFVDSQGKPFAEVLYPADGAKLLRALERSSQFVHSAVMLRTEAFRAVGGYRERFHRSEDYDLWLRLSERYAVANLDRPVVQWRIHVGQTTLETIDSQAAWNLIARACHLRRRQGEADPVERNPPPSREELMHELRIDPVAFTRARIEERTWYAKTLTRAGSPNAKAFWADAERIAATVEDDGRMLRELQATRAAVERERSKLRRIGRRIRSLVPGTP